jgi:hypothetical protein
LRLRTLSGDARESLFVFGWLSRDNNAFQSFDVFSSNIFAYYCNVGEGPCGTGCKLGGVGPADLIDKGTSQPAARVA